MKILNIKHSVQRILTVQKGYFTDSGEEIAERNLRLISLIGYSGIIVYASYLVITLLFFRDFLISPLYSLIVPVLLAFLLFSKKALRSGVIDARRAQGATFLLYITLMLYVIIMSVFPHPDVPSAYFPLFLLLAPVIFVLPAQQQFIVTWASLGLFYLLVFHFKSPACRSHELFEATTSAVFSVIAIIFMAQYRLQSDSLKEKYYKLSRQDILTGVINKNAGLESAQKYIDKMWKKEFFALLFIDIDSFKQYNDSFGHLEGDRMLKEISGALTSRCRKNDMVCRFGGDEFMMLLKDVPSLSIAAQKAQDIINAISGLDTSHTFPMSCSVGICFCSNDCSSVEEAIRKADIALYHAKNDGKSRYSIYDDSMDGQQPASLLDKA